MNPAISPGSNKPNQNQETTPEIRTEEIALSLPPELQTPPELKQKAEEYLAQIEQLNRELPQTHQGHTAFFEALEKIEFPFPPYPPRVVYRHPIRLVSLDPTTKTDLYAAPSVVELRTMARIYEERQIDDELLEAIARDNFEDVLKWSRIFQGKGKTFAVSLKDIEKGGDAKSTFLAFLEYSWRVRQDHHAPPPALDIMQAIQKAWKIINARGNELLKTTHPPADLRIIALSGKKWWHETRISSQVSSQASVLCVWNEATGLTQGRFSLMLDIIRHLGLDKEDFAIIVSEAMINILKRQLLPWGIRREMSPQEAEGAKKRIEKAVMDWANEWTKNSSEK